MPEDHIGRQWRACGQDHGHMDVESCAWTTEAFAFEFLRALGESDPPYDETWIEYRDVLYTVPTRVTSIALPNSQAKS